MTQKSWLPLEHQVYRSLLGVPLKGRRCLLMVSGGADSLALFGMMSCLQRPLGFEMGMMHCHHGSSNLSQEKFRAEAEAFVQRIAQEAGIAFYQARASEILRSEEEMRDFRKQAASDCAKKNQFDWIVWGHHRDDFLETQILRLIRGAGPEAVFQPMKLQSNADLRPLLSVARDEILSYLRDKNLQWIEDPSNADENYLRNWLRRTWLPLLEAKCPGALNAFSRSLDLISESIFETLPSEIWVREGISRPLFLTLSEAQKKQVLALYLHRLGQKEFTHNQLKEILKQLDIPQITHTFKAAHVTWTVTKELISASSPFVVNAF